MLLAGKDALKHVGGILPEMYNISLSILERLIREKAVKDLP